MKRLDTHVGAMQPTFQQTPEVLHAIGMNFAVHVLNRMIDDSVIVVRIQSVVGFKLIAVDCRSRFHMLTNLPLQSSLTAVIHNKCPHVSPTLHHSHNDSLVFSACASNDAGTLAAVHIACFSADESFVNFNLATRSAQLSRILALQCV